MAADAGPIAILAGSDQLPVLSNLPLVPNFGDMRFIH